MGNKLLNILLCLLGSGLLLLHILDLPQYRFWFSLFFLLLLFFRVMVNRGKKRKGIAPSTFFDKIETPHLILIAIFLLYLPQIYPKIKGDGVLYYAYLRSFLIDFDLNFANDFAGFGYMGKITSAGLPANPVFFGCSLFWLPFFLLAHIVSFLGNILGGNFPLDGFSSVYQRAITLGSALYILAGIILIYHLLKKRFSPGVSLLSALAIWLGTPLFYYMVANPFLAHGISMFAVTLFIFLWFKNREKEGKWRAGLIGLFAGLSAAVRPQNVVFFAIPFLDFLFSLKHSNRTPLKEKWRDMAFLLSGFALPLLIQMILWRMIFGSHFLSGWHTTNLINWRHPHIIDMLFSARHGVFTWTPLFFLGAIGIIFLLRKNRKLALYLFVAFALMLYMNGVFKRWWADHSFGNRRMLGGSFIFAFGLSAVIEELFRRPKLLATLLILSLIIWNINFATAFNQNLLGDRSEAVPLNRVLMIEGEYIYRLCYQLTAKLSDALAFRIYENYKGVWLFSGPRNLNGVIDIGAEPDDIRWELIGNGWSKKKKLDDVSFRYSEGKTSILRFPLYERAKLIVGIRMKPINLTNTTTVVVETMVNGKRVKDILLRPGWNNYLFIVEKSLTKRGLNELLFRYHYNLRGNQKENYHQEAVAVDLLRFAKKRR